MKYLFKIVCLLTLAFLGAPNAASAHTAGLQGLETIQAQAPVLKAGCYDDSCWHSRYRSHNRWGSSCEDCWRPRRHCHGEGWEGGCGHSRYWSHYRWGSYHRYWRPCRSCDWDD